MLPGSWLTLHGFRRKMNRANKDVYGFAMKGFLTLTPMSLGPALAVASFVVGFGYGVSPRAAATVAANEASANDEAQASATTVRLGPKCGCTEPAAERAWFGLVDQGELQRKQAMAVHERESRSRIRESRPSQVRIPDKIGQLLTSQHCSQLQGAELGEGFTAKIR